LVTAQAETSLQQTVSRLLERLDAMDLEGLGAMVDDEAQGVDEIARVTDHGNSPVVVRTIPHVG
jgi:hypothetical protein